MRPPVDPKAAAWDQEMFIMRLDGDHNELLRAEMRVDRDIVYTFDEARLSSAKIDMVRTVTSAEAWNMQVQVWNDLAKLYRDMDDTIYELFASFNGNDNPDIRKQQDAIDKYVSHKHYFAAMRLAVRRVFAMMNDAPPEHDGYKFDDSHNYKGAYDAENKHKIKALALATFKKRWAIKAGEAALLEAVRRHFAALE